MPSMNRVFLVGNLCNDPELRYTPSQTAVCEALLAVNERVKKNGEWKEEAVFVPVTFWSRQAEVLTEYASKGAAVLVEGRLHLQEWEKDGQKRSKLSVTSERMQLFLGEPR